MLRREIKLKALGLIIIISLFGCNKIKRNATAMHEIRRQCMENSQAIIGEKEYWDILKNINDSIEVWEKNKIGYYKYYTPLDLKVDTVICLNENANKLRTCTIRKCIENACLQDEIVYLNGVKVQNKWYFFDAGSLALIRKYYQRDIHKPLSWELMEQIAADQLYSSYLKSDGSINDHFFDELTSVAWGPATNTQAQWDSTYLAIIRSNWVKKE